MGSFAGGITVDSRLRRAGTVVFVGWLWWWEVVVSGSVSGWRIADLCVVTEADAVRKEYWWRSWRSGCSALCTLIVRWRDYVRGAYPSSQGSGGLGHLLRLWVAAWALGSLTFIIEESNLRIWFVEVIGCVDLGRHAILPSIWNESFCSNVFPHWDFPSFCLRFCFFWLVLVLWLYLILLIGIGVSQPALRIWAISNASLATKSPYLGRSNWCDLFLWIY